MSDIYAEFGVNNAVISSGLTPEEHEQEMLSKPVEVRDRDDRIEVVESNEDEEGHEEGTQQEQDGDDQEGQEDYTDEEGGEPDNGFGPVGEPDAELVSNSEQIGEHEAAFDDMVTTAVDRGLPTESVDRIRQEYDNDDGLSEKSYKELAEAGYSRAFVDSYIRGQEALVQQYVSGIMEYAGGRKSFDALFTHLQTHSPDSAEALEQAMANRDLRTVKALINLAAGSRAKSFGKPAARSVTKRGVPATAAGAPAAEGYTSTSQMIKAMSDPRYSHDAEYRASVERKVAVSNF